MNSDEAFMLSWEEIVCVYGLLDYYAEYDSNLFKRLQEALQPRDVVEG